MKKRDIETRYKDNVRKQQRILEEFAEHEIEWAGDLMTWYGYKKLEMPDDEYRACAFFQNKEYLRKPGSLTLLYETFMRCYRELPETTKENAFDILRFRYRMYAKVILTGGYDGKPDWR